MKLSEYAAKHSISYLTAYRHWKKGYISGKQLPSGTICIDEDPPSSPPKSQISTVLYARVSSSENKNNLETQMERLRQFAAAKGYTILKEVQEVGSGLNDKRPKLEKVLLSNDWDILLVEHKDRLARFGINYLQLLLEQRGQKIEVINNVLDSQADLMQDFVSLVTSFTARLYGLRRNKRQTEQLIKALEKQK